MNGDLVHLSIPDHPTRQKDTTMQLTPEVEIGLDHPREEWTCYEVMHAGEGPCRRPRRILSIKSDYPHAAAELYAQETAVQETRHDGDELSDGDTWHVAVETRPGHALFYVVVLQVSHRFESTRMEFRDAYPERPLPEADITKS